MVRHNYGTPNARWEASKWDRQLFGEDKGDVNVLNFAQMHIEALRHRMVERTQPLGQPPEEPLESDFADDTPREEGGPPIG